MTKEQIEKLATHVAWHKPIANNNGNILYFFTNGEVIRFTGIEYTAQNAQFEINNLPYRKIWFSQLTNFYFSNDFESIYRPIIELKNGTSPIIADSFDADSL